MSEDHAIENPVSVPQNNALYLHGSETNLSTSYDENMLRNLMHQNPLSNTFQQQESTVSNAPYRHGHGQYSNSGDNQQLQQHRHIPFNSSDHQQQQISYRNMMLPDGSMQPLNMNYTASQNNYNTLANYNQGPYMVNNYSSNYVSTYGSGNYLNQHGQRSNFYPVTTMTGSFMDQGNVSNFNNMSYNEQRASPRQAWGLHSEPQASNTAGQRKSLDETHAPLQNTSSYIRQHRRGRSDDSHHIHSISDCSIIGVPPVRQFHSPPPQRARVPMHMSRSTTSLVDNSHLMGYNNSNRLPHSMSVDTSVLSAQMVNGKLCDQSNRYVGLTTGIQHAQYKLNELETEVIEKEKHLFGLLAAQTNPTEKEYLRLKEENEILHREIQQMWQECDRLEIPPFPEEQRGYITPEQKNVQPTTPGHTPPKRVAGNSNEPLTTNIQPYLTTPTSTQNHRPNLHHGTSQSIVTPQPPAYDTVADPVPPYGSVVSYTVSPRPITPRAMSLPPPPLPPRPPHLLPPSVRNSGDGESSCENEHWLCPSCTFKNLLVAECEVCYTPRPSTVS